MAKIFIGIDNGVSGTIGVVKENDADYYHMPVRKCLEYTKGVRWVSRIDVPQFIHILELVHVVGNELIVVLERPFINPMMFRASLSAIRALEATVIVMEQCKLQYSYIDSHEWQKALLPGGVKGKDLKLASLDIGKRLFPRIDFKGFGDADGLLIAEYSRRKALGIPR